MLHHNYGSHLIVCLIYVDTCNVAQYLDCWTAPPILPRRSTGACLMSRQVALMMTPASPATSPAGPHSAGTAVVVP